MYKIAKVSEETNSSVILHYTSQSSYKMPLAKTVVAHPVIRSIFHDWKFEKFNFKIRSHCLKVFNMLATESMIIIY